MKKKKSMQASASISFTLTSICNHERCVVPLCIVERWLVGLDGFTHVLLRAFTALLSEQVVSVSLTSPRSASLSLMVFSTPSLTRCVSRGGSLCSVWLVAHRQLSTTPKRLVCVSQPVFHSRSLFPFSSSPASWERLATLVLRSVLPQPARRS